MNWTADEVRKLRCRLGWSQAEMARNLNLELMAVSNFESGRTEIPSELSSSLLRILHQAESNSERVQRRPIAEVIMRDQNLSQIHDYDVEMIQSERPLGESAVRGKA